MKAKTGLKVRIGKLCNNQGPMKRVFIVHGMRRSGNHGIINWLKAHDRFIFYNDIISIRRRLTGEKEFPPPEDFNQWLGRKRIPLSLKLSFFMKASIFKEYSLIASLEDHSLTFRPFCNVPRELIHILILRDPCNMFSSRIRRASLKHSSVYSLDIDRLKNRDVELWKSYAQEFAGLTNYLENKVCIFFDAWVSNQNYRKQISRKLNLEFTDAGFTKVSAEGGGSSFDKTKFDGNAQMMNVLNRKADLNKSELHILEDLLADDDLQKLRHIILESHMKV